MNEENHEYNCEVCKHRYECVRVSAFLMANVYPYSDGCENFEKGCGMNNKAHLRPKDYDSNGDIFPMEIVAGKCPIEVGGNCPLRPQGEWDIVERTPYYAILKCSNCEDTYKSDYYDGEVFKPHYCIWCGADMRPNESAD